MDYGPALEAAIECAYRAGTILRREFYRGGGPRSLSGRCVADDEAEHCIRERLLSAFPSWAFWGRVLGRLGPDHASHRWVVEAHDGAESMVRGHRGAALSIALETEGEAVLGVIHAYAPPIGSGDLTAWARGCGPLRHNADVSPRQWADDLGPEHTVMSPLCSDACLESIVKLAAPARVRSIPSPAYRFALALAGRAEAAIAFSSEEPESVLERVAVAVHALARGVDGYFVQAPGGRSLVASRSIVNDLRRLRWDLRNEDEPCSDVLAAPRPDRIADPDVYPLDRAQGVLLGLLIGDALGSLVEFRSARSIRENYPDGIRHIVDGGTWGTLGGQPTDDGELALSLARCLLREGTYRPERVLEVYRRWYDSNPFDVGATIGQAFGYGMPSSFSQANGALMRIAPLAIAGWRAGDAHLLTWAGEDALLSHPHPICRVANIVYVAAIAAALRGDADPWAMHRSALAALSSPAALQADEGVEPVRTRLRSAEHQEPPPLDGSRQGWVLYALHNAFFELLHADGFEDGLVRTVQRGGDTDTNGAITAALLGARFGAAAIPHRWVDRVLTCRPLPYTSTRHPRPPCYWPIDALVLAEQLLFL